MSEKYWLFADYRWHGNLVKELGTPLNERKFSQGNRLEIRKLVGSLFDLLENQASLENLVSNVNEQKFILVSWNRPLFWWVNIYYMSGGKKRYIYDYKEFIGYLQSLAVVAAPNPTLGDIALYETLSKRRKKANINQIFISFLVNAPQYYKKEFKEYPVFMI